MDISMRLKELRKEKGVSQKAVADYLGITQRAYSYYETGQREPTLDNLVMLRKFFEVSTDYLLGVSDLY